MKETISIIIPVYNASKFLNKCLNSVINQTYKNLEIIIVDDGSTDTSREICEEYSKRDQRIKFYSKKNEGVSIARNYGLMKCTGEYISFVDSDDYIETNMYEKMLMKIKETNSMLCVCNIFYEDTSGIQTKKNLMHEQMINGISNCLYALNMPCIGGYCCNKLYKRELIIDRGLFFDSKITLCEDELFNTEVLNFSDISIFYINDLLYHYVLHSSNSVKSFNVKSLTLFDALEREMKIFEDNNLDTSYLKFRYYISYIKLKCILRVQKINYLDIKKIQKNAVKYIKDINTKLLYNNKNRFKLFLARYLSFVFKIKIYFGDNSII